jgi:hypothetical protein
MTRRSTRHVAVAVAASVLLAGCATAVERASSAPADAADRSASSAATTDTWPASGTTPTAAPVPSPMAAPAAAAGPTRAPVRHVMFAGDSVARGAAPAVEAALRAAGVEASSIAFDGAGIMAAPDDSLEVYADALAFFDPDVVVYQLSLWDRGSADQQRAAYGAFAALVTGTGARLVFVTPPPMERPDEHPDLERLRSIAAALAHEQPDAVHLLDADAVWGATYTRDIGGDGAADRMKDGVHVCQGGAMQFGAWLVDALEARFDGIRSAPLADWVFGPWNASTAYDVPADACDPVRADRGVPSDA